ncbi:MAG: diguanylate cyclase (GGDEF)-like protein [Gammaproteobacteria bacterium]|jgi:diguanylate cyclase (GGDEF)-like protein
MMSIRPNITLDFPIAGTPIPTSARVLPIINGQTKPRKLISDSTVLQVSTALQASLHVKDVVHAFANEIRRIVRVVSVRYRNRDRQIVIEDGQNQLHRSSYELNLLGNSLGEISFTRNQTFSETDQELLEVLLCALVYPLRNALLYEQALTQALKDPLTGVNNRASMDAYLKHQILVTERHKTPLSLIMTDVDLFKSVNDTFGHVVGDIVLRGVADAIVKCTRDSDVVFRYGGEEFAVILTNTEGAGADFLAERIRQSVAALEIEALANNTKVTISAGVAEFVTGDCAMNFLARADERLYKAKVLGRNRVQASSD